MPKIAKNRRIAREVIITYYRRHARGSKVTLKELCDQAGLDYGYCRVIKVQYDKNRKRPPIPDIDPNITKITHITTNTDEPHSAPEGSTSD